MQPKAIFLDLDGVLNNWQLYQLKQFGVPSHLTLDDWPKDSGWDIVDALNKLAGVNWSSSLFWDSVVESDWADAPKSELFDLLIEESRDIVGRENVFVFTSPTYDPRCASGKVKWCQRHLPSWMQRQVIIGSAKHVAAQAGHVLFDDADHNVAKWREFGGEACLVPRPWNENSHLDAVQHVTNVLEQFKCVKTN